MYRLTHRTETEKQFPLQYLEYKKVSSFFRIYTLQ